jgi:hypothetical protein
MEATGGNVKEIGRVSGWAMAIFEPNLSPYKHAYSNIFKLSRLLYLSDYEDGTECSETSAYKNLDARELPRFENVGVFIREKV